MQKTKKPVLEESVFFGYDALKPSFRRGKTVKVDEIAIILEDIRGKFDLVLEGHEALKSYMDRPYEALDRKIDKNTFLIGALNDKIDNVRTELCGEIQEVRSELGGKIDGSPPIWLPTGKTRKPTGPLTGCGKIPRGRMAAPETKRLR